MRLLLYDVGLYILSSQCPLEIGEERREETTHLDLLDLGALVVLQLGHLALDTLDVGLSVFVLRLRLFDLGLKLGDGVLDRLDFADDLRERTGSVREEWRGGEDRNTDTSGVAVLH